ncbi:hypothetical protein LINPERHAP1_LOCUS1671 [Linum perenne]
MQQLFCIYLDRIYLGISILLRLYACYNLYVRHWPVNLGFVLMRGKLVTGSYFDVQKAETSQQQLTAVPTLDMKQAELSRQHVRALNSQFSSWVQAQLKNHPDELWEDGVRDYLAHASHIMEKFSDVVKWLRENAEKGGPSVESYSSDKKLSPQMKKNENNLPNDKAAFAPVVTSVAAPWSSGIFSNIQSSGGVSGSPNSGSLFSNSQSSGMFSSSQSTGLLSKSQSPGLLSSSQSAGFVSNSQNLGSFASNESPGLSSNSEGAGLFSNNKGPTLFSNTQITGLFSSSQSSGLFSFNPSSAGGFSSSQAPIMFGGQSSVPTSNNASDDAEDADELPKPSSPSVKKAEEEGVVVVHEVKCKLYVKKHFILQSIDGADKDTWKDKGPGKLSIKCTEGISKGTKESNPTIIVRNDVGKVLLNALLYQGIKMNLQKNAIVAIFHVAADESGSSESVAARTFLIRTKTVEDRDNLAAAIREYAPES